MKRLLKNGTVVNVFVDELEAANVLIEDGKIIGVGDYTDEDADVVEDVSGKYLCPGFIDGHIHIESTTLTPAELTKLCMPRGTTAIIADPHEIANVCGTDGIRYMMAASEGLPLHVYFALPSCVPATPNDESGAVLTAADLAPFYANERVVALGEMMNYPGVLAGDADVHRKIADALAHGRVVDGHAPLVRGRALDRYAAAGVQSDHECTCAEEAIEQLRKGQWIMIRQGTAAKDLLTLLPLFSSPYDRRCILATDDRHPADIVTEGHIDNIVRLAVQNGVDALKAIRMATIQAAQCFRLPRVGAIAPAYRADILVLNDLDTVDVCDVYSAGEKVVENKVMQSFSAPRVPQELVDVVTNSFHLDPISPSDLYLAPKGENCHVIGVLPGTLVTEDRVLPICWEKNNGVDTARDILKIAVIERHKNTGHRGVGFISGIGLQRGAIASSVSHDSHNIIVIGTNDADMATAANHIRSAGGSVVVVDGEVVADMKLPVAGLMADRAGEDVARDNEAVREAVYRLGVPRDIEPFMNMAFVSLSVIPSLKMLTTGLIDVNKQEKISLYCE